MPSLSPPIRLLLRLCAAALLLLLPLFRGTALQAKLQATAVPLILPGGLDYDAAGNLYFAETGKHLIRMVSPSGILSTVAGNGVQGFSGDGGAATAAMLDSPTAVAHDRAGNMYIADAHNHRIRRVDALTGIISTFAGTGLRGLSPDATAATQLRMDLPTALAFDTAGNLYFADAQAHVVRRIDHLSGLVATVAGNGVQGFSGDGGAAIAANIDSPYGLAIDASGNIFFADTHNHRVRRVDAATGVISSVAGTGLPGFGGDAGLAGNAKLSLPRGLALDAQGNLFVVDSRNQRLRRIDATTGQIQTIAGSGVQGFSGDGSAATLAEMNSPRAVTLAPGGSPTLSDTGNNRVRQLDSAANIQTIAGLADTVAATLSLSGASTDIYGTGSVTATLSGSAASGEVVFLDTSSAPPQTLASVPLSSNTASFSVASLHAGSHRLIADYSGDASHAPSESGTLALTVNSAPVTATTQSASILYGQSPPLLTGTLTGVLPQDVGEVSLVLTSGAGPAAVAGTYPVLPTLTGPAAANYAVTLSAPAAVVIARAPSSITLSGSLATHVASSTTGIPSGTVTLLDGGVAVQTSPLSATGDASFSSATLSNGTHTLTATYAGDSDFLGATSAAEIATIGPGAAPDFSLASLGTSSQTVVSGSAASFSFAMTPSSGPLASPVQFSVAGLPAGATATFSPAYLPPGAAATNFTMTVQTAKLASLRRRNPLLFAGVLPLLLLFRRRRRRMALLALLAGAGLGCGDRINTAPAAAISASYNVTVTAVATSATGATLQHSATVVLTLQ